MGKDILKRKLRFGMVGGGPGAFIGAVHRRAAVMDGEAELVAGAFSRDPAKSAAKGRELHLDPSRVYGSFAEMARAEAKREDRIDFVSIVTPNDAHFAPAKAFLEAGFHVILDKPLAFTVAEARQLAAIVKKTKRVFALTHNYTGYPMVKVARDLVRKGLLGPIRKIVSRYPQGWLYNLAEKDPSNRQAAWRTDPRRCGAAGCIGDLATHAENLAGYVTGLRIVSLCADLTTFVKGRRLDDDGNILVHWEKGAKGLIHASQISIAEENGLAIDVYGEKMGLSWEQENPNRLLVKYPDKPVEIWTRANGYVGNLSPAAVRATRIPAGHPEGYHESFANLYRNVMETIRCVEAGVKPPPLALDFPTVEDGLRGMLFIEAVVKSSKAGAKWITMPKA
jgi:predicted dehydrogenase